MLLLNIFVNSDNAAFSSKNGILYNKDFSKLVMYPQDNPTVNLVLPEGLKEISDGIFRNNHILKTILIPSSVINIGAGITESTSIESIIVDSNNAVYDSRNNCNAIVESKANKLIAGCKNTVIPNNVEIIGTRALNNVGISTINLHTGIKKIEADGVSAVYVNIPSIEAWLNIVGDDSYSYPVDTISGTLCINNEPITNVVIPGSVTAIKDYAFKSQNQIESITIKNGVTSIGSYAFSGTSIKSLTIPASISEIGSTIFEGCYNLSTVNFENGIKHVNGSMFFSSYVEEITIPPSVSSISDNLWGLNFAAEENGKICVVNVEDLASFAKISLLFPQGELNSLILKHNGATVTDLVIDNSITSIGQAFNGFQSIKSITIPTSVKSISEYAFNCCSNLTSITYEGTTAQWEQMNVPPTSLPAGITITCTNGTLTTA